jgi:hypothetical protein
MMKYLIPIAMLLILGTTASGTMWLYNADFFMLGPQSSAASFKPASLSPFEIINAPFFPLLGEGFNTDPIPLQLRNATTSVEITSTGKSTAGPVLATFNGHLENNLKYAVDKSSVRVGKGGSWNSLNVPGLI